MNNVSAFLKSIDSNSNPEKILRRIVGQKSQVAGADETSLTNRPPRDAIDYSENDVKMLQDEIERLSNLVNLYQDRADLALPDIKDLINRSVFDYKTGYNATIYYDADWFANALFSEQGKVELADYILNVIKTYCNDNLDLLESISNTESDIMEYIRYPRKADDDDS
jgi:hypothetical protein